MATMLSAALSTPSASQEALELAHRVHLMERVQAQKGLSDAQWHTAELYRVCVFEAGSPPTSIEASVGAVDTLTAPHSGAASY
jgi:hypothetical protein